MAKKISVNGGIGFEFTADILRENLLNESGDIEINLNSSGGSVYDAFEIYNEIINYRNRTGSKVTIMLNGLVASAAAYLSMAATERIAYDNSVFMIHNAEIIAYGDYRTMEFWGTDLKKTDKVIASAYSKASGRSLTDIHNYMSDNMDNNGTYFYGQEIVNAGFASKIIDTETDKDRQNSITESKMMILNFNKTMKPVTYDHEKIIAMLKTNTQQGKENIGEERMEKKDILAALLVL
ncbi:Clp protease ClpP, partial [bacterium]|nr:Clp protease ClpP [bacterium]